MLIGLLGGTFDPVHRGHLHVAQQCLQRLNLDAVRLLPCFQPVHRPPPRASAEHRVAMLRLACAEQAHISVDEHEINRQGPSYMIDTLRELRQEHPDDEWCLILGQDAFQTFDHWQEWQNILSYCHLLIVNRPRSEPHYSPSLQQFINQHQAASLAALKPQAPHQIFFVSIPPRDVSATQLRQQLAQRHIDHTQLPDAVSTYILQHHLYR